MPLCLLCSSLDFGAISRTPVSDLFKLTEFALTYYIYIPQSSKTENNFTPHYDSLSRLSINAKSCKLCYLIQSNIDLYIKSRESEFGVKTLDYELWLSGRADADGFQILGVRKDPRCPRHYYHILGVFGFALDNVESHLKDIIQRRPVPLSPLSSSVLERIRGWVEECTEKHEHTPQAYFMPTRVLEITNFGRQVRLYFPSTEHSKYAALSHCWGSTQPTTLTSRSLHKFEAGIRTEELPQTFQDAIWLTHQLKTQFLWIDSLCIVQDDPDDWAQESAMMHNVYNNAFFSIAASRASKGSEGFLGNRIERSYVSVPFHHQGIASGILAFALPTTHVGYLSRRVWMENEPLSHRGWTFQERYLSRRTLHFTSDQIFFECEKFCLAEDTFKSYQYPSFSEIMSRGRLREMDDTRYFTTWYELVEKYSLRVFTIKDDKLPAFSGLAAYFSRERSAKSSAIDLSNQYLAGLWSDDIILGLCWISPGGRHPTKYRAPSWSWASVDGTIEYYRPDSRWDELAVVENTHVDLESPGRSFGKVLGGWISMKVIKLEPCADSVTDDGDLRFSDDGVNFTSSCLWDGSLLGTSRIRELVLSVMEETELLVVPLGWRSYKFELWFLIVKRVDYANHSQTAAPIFQRIGFGRTIIEPEGDSSGLKRLITEKWAVMKQQGNLENIVII